MDVAAIQTLERGEEMRGEERGKRKRGEARQKHEKGEEEERAVNERAGEEERRLYTL